MSFWIIIVWIIMSTLLGYLKVKYSYWDLMGVQQLKAHFLFGNIGKLKSLSHTDLMQEVYDTFKTRCKLAGTYIFTKPVAVILDLDVVKAVLIKDFNKFSSRMDYKNDKDILAQHLFNVEGSLWRPLRNKLTPAFTSGKMKFMFPTIERVTEELKKSYDKNLKESPTLNVRDLSGRFTTDVIGTCLFGIECNSLKDPKTGFHQITSKIFGRSNFNIKWYLFKTTYVRLMKFIGFKRYPQFIEDCFRSVVHKGVMEREKSGIVRNDFVDILLELKKTPDMSLTYDQIAAQFFLFFAAGFETSSTTMSNALFELGRHPEMQQKVRKEILKTLEAHDNEMSYEAIMEMKYLDQVIAETLRMYPPLHYLERFSTDDFKVPDTDITLEKGTMVYIPVYAIHHDPAIYENPMAFRPERFSPSEVVKRHPLAFLSFGDGPRNCIGLRFGRMQTKLGLITLLSNYRFSHTAETCKEIEFSKHSIVVLSQKDIWLKVEKLVKKDCGQTRGEWL